MWKYNDVNIADTVVALGKFEGLHKGHMLLINKVLQLSHEAGKQSVVFSIDMPGTKRIYTIPERDRLLEELGIDWNVTCEFTKKFAAMKPETFIKDVLVERLHPEYVVVGNDFRFGKNRQGDVTMLQEYGTRYGFEVLAFEKLREQGTIISSSYIREQIEQGAVDVVREYMGRPYSISGIVQYGKQLGATIGFPTANLIPTEEKLLVTGIFTLSHNTDPDTSHRYVSARFSAGWKAVSSQSAASPRYRGPYCSPGKHILFQRRPQILHRLSQHRTMPPRPGSP